jgi:hypothetical protein
MSSRRRSSIPLRTFQYTTGVRPRGLRPSSAGWKPTSTPSSPSSHQNGPAHFGWAPIMCSAHHRHCVSGSVVNRAAGRARRCRSSAWSGPTPAANHAQRVVRALAKTVCAVADSGVGNARDVERRHAWSSPPSVCSPRSLRSRTRPSDTRSRGRRPRRDCRSSSKPATSGDSTRCPSPPRLALGR